MEAGDSGTETVNFQVGRGTFVVENYSTRVVEYGRYRYITISGRVQGCINT